MNKENQRKLINIIKDIASSHYMVMASHFYNDNEKHKKLIQKIVNRHGTAQEKEIVNNYLFSENINLKEIIPDIKFNPKKSLDLELFIPQEIKIDDVYKISELRMKYDKSVAENASQFVQDMNYLLLFYNVISIMYELHEYQALLYCYLKVGIDFEKISEIIKNSKNEYNELSILEIIENIETMRQIYAELPPIIKKENE